jgi:hypothetical protein
MAETVIPYERFLEIRQRRQRVVAEPTAGLASLPNGDDGDPVTIDCEVLTDKLGEKLTETAAVRRRENPVA